MTVTARSNRYNDARKTCYLICAIEHTVAALLHVDIVLQNDRNDNTTLQTGYLETSSALRSSAKRLFRRLNERRWLLRFGDLDNLPEPDSEWQASLIGTMVCTTVCLDVEAAFRAYCGAVRTTEQGFASGQAGVQGWANVHVDLREALVEKNERLNAKIDRWLGSEFVNVE
ncbi:hypothetical protein B0A55_10101 [Friedmanniomyces simplex]|uniref:Uncharacterized protein n=1 Tax=Friedmanniomyces simplex TaxID=329884 RepID=A0A4U0WJI1_9PEZI|nr:hypothetical protein B0A55_10101 [Friedmanniomyces simplex]